MHGKLAEVDGRCPGRTKIDGILRKVSGPLKKFMDIVGKSPGCTES